LDKIIDGQIDWRMISVLVPYADDGITSQIEAAVVEGALPWEALGALNEGIVRRHEKEIRDGER
ncbi:MAG TPA: hypothetical protein PKZ58_04935, partial [Bacillota bacterium]|nr:hypothetical protein [Bacillota bacterium]